MPTGYEVAMYRHIELIKNHTAVMATALDRIATALEKIAEPAITVEMPKNPDDPKNEVWA